MLLHFSGGTSHMWDGIIPLIENEYNIVAPDNRGHGKSDKPITGYHIDDMANDIFLLLQELEVRQCHIIGSSLGAEVGLSLAANHPEMVQSFVCEGALYNEFGEFGQFKGTDEEIEREKESIRLQLASRILPNHPTKEAIFNEMKDSFINQGLWNEYFASFVESCIEKTDEGSFTSHYKNNVRIEYITKYWDLRFEDYYKKVRCPVLFLPSEEEWGHSNIRGSLEAFASFLKFPYEIVQMKDSIHAYVWMQQPTIAGRVALDFIKKYS